MGQREKHSPITSTHCNRQWAFEPLEQRQLLSAAINPIVAENQNPGTPSSVWNVPGAGDPTIQGFSTDISVNQGQTVSFKINDTASAPYHVDIYRVGYYQGLGARLITTIPSSQTLDVVQPAAKFDPTTALVDAGNWSVTASWAVPSTATSGVYFARVARNDTGGAFMIPFVVRSDSSHSAVLFQTADATWEAYNTWGGYSLYQYTGSTAGPGYQGAAYAVSYNRPFINAGTAGGLGVTNWFFYDEYPMVRWLEQNGYDVSYMTDVDTDRLGAAYIEQHQLFLSVGHDEYWTGNQFNNVTAARNAGVNLAFFSGNEVFWKTYLSNSIDGSNTPDRTLVCYKETHANAIIDPNNPNVWTGTFEDPRFSPPADGGQPQNQLTGTLFDVNRGPNDVGTPFTVPYADSQLRLWRNTSVANLQAGQTATLGDYELGYEWDEDVDNGFRPAGEIDLSSTTESVTQKFIDYGNTTAAGTATNSLTLYRASSGALVFSAGMVQYDWGLDGNHDDVNGNLGLNSTPVTAIEQATVNLFADMYIQPQTLAPGLVTASASTDTIAPTSIIAAPLNGAALMTGQTVTISGTSSDSGGGVVAGVEVSVDGGQTWHPAQGTTNWTYSWVPSSAGKITILSRATDDSCNTEKPSAGITVSVSYQPTSRTGLVAEYNFDQGSGTTLVDTSGNGNNGTIANATWTQGMFGDALSFNGTNSLVTINDSNSLNLTTGMTLEAWVNPAALSNWNAVIIKERTNGLAYGMYADNGQGEPPSGYVDIAKTDEAVLAPNALPLNTWTFLSATYDGSTLSFYVNGTLVNSSPYFGSIITATNPLRIGGDSIWGEYFDGLIDQVRIYNRPLNQGEIRTDMGTPVGGSIETSSPTAAMTAPANGATVSGITTLTAAASDAVYVQSVQFLLDGRPVGNQLTVAPYNLSWDTRTVLNGTHVLSVVAQNVGGQTVTSASETITVNNPPNTTPPTVSMVYPLSGFDTAGKFVLDCVASDPYGITQVQYQLNGVNLGPALTSAPYRLLFDTSGLATGTYNITAVAQDTSGNTSASAPATITVDHTPPSVVSTSPTAASTGVSTASSLTATFSEPVQPGSVSVLLQDPSGNAVTTSVNYDDSTNTATISHGSVALEPLTTYTVTVTATDLAGNTMSPFVWHFSTGSAIVGATIWEASTVPGVPSASDSSAVELGVKFRSDIAGTITGIRFYKGGTSNGGTHIGHLWSSTGALLATATFTNETSSGWQQVNFASPVAIAANTTYIASYYAPQGFYADDSGYFLSSAVNSGPLHALQNGTDGPNGLYSYGADGFPTNSYQGSNYWVDVVFNGSTTDTTPPTVTGEFPAPNSTGIPQTAAVTVTFSKAVQPSTISFVLTDSSGNVVPSTFAYNSSNNSATLTPNAMLGSLASYTATVSGATDLAGNVMASPFSWSFSTASASAPPTVTAETPAPGATNVGKGNSITATFSKPIDASTLSFVLRDAAGNTIPSTVSYDDESSTATLTPSAALSAGTSYTAIVSGATDLSGNVMTAPFSWSFTTANAAGSVTIWSSTATPTVASASDTSSIELGVKFTSDTAGYITGIRFYKGALNTGTHIGHLWTSGGALLASATFTGETASGWEQVNFASPVAIAANTTYVASYYAPVGGYSYTNGAFTTAGVDNAPLHALANGTSGGNGVYLYAAGGGFPTNSYNSTNYWVDVVFTTAAGSSAPTVVSSSPASSATGVAVTVPITATFGAPVQASTISFVLKDSSGNLVPAAMAYNSSTQVAALTPGSPLITGITYTATISGAQDSSGNTMAPTSWSFTTVSAISVWDSSVVPSTPSASDPSAVEVGMKFRTDVAGQITGLKFYKGAANTGTHVGHLWTSTGQLLASVTFSGETASGWQTALFSSPVSIQPSTTYVISYYAPVGEYAVSGGYFASGGASNGPLHALANGVDGANGVYLYAAGGGFPTASYNSTNYWIDPLFSDLSQVGAAPAVTQQTPGSGANGVSSSASVTASFSEAVQPSTISFVLRDGSGNVVSSTVTYNAATDTAALTPNAPLANGTTYSASLTATSAGGVAMANPVTWSFTTAPLIVDASLWTASTTPETPSVNDTNAVELGVKFTADYDGYVSAIRFYKGSLNTGTHVAHLWASDGTLLGTATFSNETATGWQLATFTSPIAIKAGITYVASYFAPQGGYALNAGYFASAGFDSGPLHALSSSSAGGNGVYLYGAAGGFPTNTYNGGNYWIDVVYSTTLDTTPPTVTAASPAAGTTGVPVNSTVTTTFSEPVQSGSATFTLTDSNGVSVPASVNYDLSSQTYTLTPLAPLANTMTYTASISGVKDLSGNVMTAAYTWSFTTAGQTTQTTVADFAAGTGSGTTVTNSSGGEVQLASALYDDFTSTSLSSTWTTSSWASEGGGPMSITSSGSILSVSGGEISAPVTSATAAVEGRVQFAATPYQNFGLATGLDTAGNYWAMFGTQGTTNTLFARLNVNGALTDVSLGALPAGFHLYTIQPVAGGFQFYVDNVLATTINASIPTGTQMNLIASTFSGSPSPALQLDWVQVNSYAFSGTFVSSVINAGQTVTWNSANWDANVPAGTTLTIQVRGSTDGSTWTAWQTVTNGVAFGTPLTNQYLQYQVIMTTTDPSLTPVLSDITLDWS